MEGFEFGSLLEQKVEGEESLWRGEDEILKNIFMSNLA